jgi:NADH:ubiquinone oxidoreductase subunit H
LLLILLILLRLLILLVALLLGALLLPAAVAEAHRHVLVGLPVEYSSPNAALCQGRKR